MKKLISNILLYIFLFLFLSGTNLYPQSGWFWQHPYPQGNCSNDLFFLNKNTGWITTFAQVMKTTNGGINWNISSNYYRNFESIFFLNENTGWAGDYDSLFKTTNGGVNWINQYFNTWGHAIIYDIIFFNQQTGLTLTDDYIFKTTNGGTNWDIKNYNNYGQIRSFAFPNNLTGWVCGDSGKFYKTTNGGENWFIQNSGIPAMLNRVSFVDSLNGYSCGKYGTFIKTTNGGNNWSLISAFGNYYNLMNCAFYNTNTGWVTYSTDWEHGVICKTTDGGNSWNTFNTINAINDIAMVDSVNLYSSGYGIIKTADGNNWIPISNGVTNWFNSVCFIDENTGWTVGGNIYSNNMSALLKTTNGGINWIENANFATSPINTICFINANTGWTAGDNAKILKSTNGGVNWIMTNLNTYREIFSLYFLNENTGWAAGGDSYGGIFKTTDGGANWVEQNISAGQINSITFFNENTGWVGSGGLYHTTNGGQNWQNIYIGSIGGALYFDFININTGWVVGAWGGILKTTNGGSVFVNNNSIMLPEKYFLFQNYPNPFNPITTIEYSIPKTGLVTIKVYDIIGREMTTVVNEVKRAGYYQVLFEGTGLASGVYFYRIVTEDFVQTKRMVMVK